MDLGAWSLGEHDTERRKRLAVGYFAGVSLCIAIGATAWSLRGIARADDDEPLDVQLAASVPTEAAKPPPPPPPAIAEPRAPEVAPGPPRKRVAPPPTSIPKETPPESTKPVAPGAPGDGEVDFGGRGSGGVIGGTGTGTGAAPPPPPAAPPPPPKPAGPVQLPENATPPTALSNPAPPFPDAARAAGVEATVVVRFVVTESGEVSQATVVRGHPLFDAAVLAAVRSWRYRPAVFQGRPIPVFHVVRIPFKLKT